MEKNFMAQVLPAPIFFSFRPAVGLSCPGEMAVKDDVRRNDRR